MGTRFAVPEGKLRSNLGLLAGTVIRELRMHPFKEMPLPLSYESNPGCSPFVLRCMEIDEAALLIRDPDAFAAAAAEAKMSKREAGAYLEPPSKKFREHGGCPFYQGKYRCRGSTSVLCQVVGPQLHGYVEIKFCEEGRKVYCPIWRAKGVMLDVSKLDTFPETEENRPGSGAAVQS